MLTETITWYMPAERLPDSDTTVLLRMPEGWDEPVWPGFHNGEVWCDESGVVVDEPLLWADLPAGEATHGVTAAPVPQQWRGLTKDEIDHAVGELVEYGTDFVAPLYSVVEGIERKLRERNGGVPEVDRG